MTARSTKTVERVKNRCRLFVDSGGSGSHTSRDVPTVAEAVAMADELRAIGFNPWISVDAEVVGYSYKDAKDRASEPKARRAT